MTTFMELLAVSRRLLHPELLIWAGALLWLATIDPAGAHFSLCPLYNLGLSWCPGCGLGHAVSHVLHGQLGASWQAHPLAVPALLILMQRCYTLWNRFIPTTPYA